ncbi:MAG: hypothetical protein F9K18_09275, partial [Thermoanaerobaculia bacterium]
MRSRSPFLALTAAPCLGLALAAALPAQVPDEHRAPPAPRLLLVPDRVFDGVSEAARSGWVVLVEGERIAAAG